MVHEPVRRASTVLHIALGLILAAEGAIILSGAVSEHHEGQLIAFGAAQIVGAVLFVWRRTILMGGCVVLCASLIAACVHAFEGEFPAAHLVAAVAVLYVVVQNGGWAFLRAVR